LNRFPRDLNALFEVLDKLDQESLIKQRRITIPFIREVFADKA
jgi:DnaA family protein